MGNQITKWFTHSEAAMPGYITVHQVNWAVRPVNFTLTFPDY